MIQTIPFSEQLTELQTAFRERTDWTCLAELLAGMAALTGSSGWSDSELRRGVLLYGAGSIGAGAFEYYTRQGIPVLGFIDDTPGKEGQSYCGVEIIPFSSALKTGCPIVISMKLWAGPAAKIAEAGGTCEAFAHGVFHASLKQMAGIAESLLDDRSRLVYLTILKANILADYSVYASVFEGNQYWAIPEFQYLPDSSGIMVDAGSYVGDTVEEFVWRTRGMFKSIHAFEPDPRCFRALGIRASRLRQEWGLREEAIRCVAAGLGQENAELPFFQHFSGADGSFLFASGKPNGTLTVRKLDDYLGQDGLTFLKADVEGYEMPLLLGASGSIRKHRPKLAICIYHRITDLIEIPLLLRELVPEYKMAVRHHSFGQDESVLYCWV